MRRFQRRHDAFRAGQRDTRVQSLGIGCGHVLRPSGIMQRWDAGYHHTKSVLEKKPWVGEFDPLSGVILHEQMEVMPEAAE